MSLKDANLCIISHLCNAASARDWPNSGHPWEGAGGIKMQSEMSVWGSLWYWAWVSQQLELSSILITWVFTSGEKMDKLIVFITFTVLAYVPVESAATLSTSNCGERVTKLIDSCLIRFEQKLIVYRAERTTDIIRKNMRASFCQ